MAGSPLTKANRFIKFQEAGRTVAEWSHDKTQKTLALKRATQRSENGSCQVSDLNQQANCKSNKNGDLFSYNAEDLDEEGINTWMFDTFSIETPIDGTQIREVVYVSQRFCRQETG